MKMFGWIQCKFRSSNSALQKDSANGNSSCFSLKSSCNNQQNYLTPKTASKGKIQHENEFEFGDATEETFPGFLTIGTLNLESMASEPATPTFGFLPDEAVYDDNMEEVKYDLKVIKEELEKLSKQGSESEAKTCHPLQGYLFASSYDLSEPKEEVAKEMVPVLQEIDTYLSVNVEKKQDQVMKRCKVPAHPMRRILCALQSSQKRNAVVREDDSTKSSSSSRKFDKIKRLFRRKVHPEKVTAVKEGISCNTCKINGNANICRHSSETTDEIWEKLGQNCSSKLSQSAIAKMSNQVKKKSNDTNDEHWIRSDADYLVLELGQK